MKNNDKKTLKKLAILVIGSMIAAYGITLALYAGFGGATLAVLWQGLARTFHISIGAASFVVAVGMILFALIYDKSQIHIGTVLYQIVYSACVDLFANCHIYSTYEWINFIIMLLGVVLFAVGTGLYASASLGRGSYEAVTFALAEKITGRLNLSEWHWIFWLLLQVFCLVESLVYARLLQLSFQVQLFNLLMQKQNKF